MYFLLSILFTLLYSCHYSTSEEHYEELKADKVFHLHQKLDEISALAFDRDSNIVCVNDEVGIVYTLDRSDGKIINEKSFKKEGDFEGIAVLNDVIYVLESDGDLFQLINGNRTKYDLFKHKDFEFEGLCLLDENSLLISAKHHKNKEKDEEFIWIYKFNLRSKVVDSNAFIKLKRNDSLSGFVSSAIDYNQSKKQIYLLSSKTGQLLIVDENEKINQLIKFNKVDLPQAEGILIDAKGGLFIATEKNTLETAKLLYFESKNFK